MEFPSFPRPQIQRKKGGGGCRTFFGRQESSLFSRTRWLTGALRVQCNWAWKSSVFLSPLMRARQKHPPVSLENVGDISERKKSGAVVGCSQLEQPIGDDHRGRGTADTLYAVFSDAAPRAFARSGSCKGTAGTPLEQLRPCGTSALEPSAPLEWRQREPPPADGGVGS